MLLQSLLTNLAAAGLATKAAAGGAAVVVAASAAGAADVLPDPAQETFDRITAEEVVGAEDEGVEGETFGARVSQDATGESDGEAGVDGSTIACEASQGRSGTCGEGGEGLESTGESDDGEFGKRVSQDATGESDGEPGVDGEEISDEARASNPGQGEEGADNARDDVPADDDDDDDDGRRGPEGTPGEDALDTFRPGDEG